VKLKSYEEAQSQLNTTRAEILRQKEELALQSAQFAIDYAVRKASGPIGCGMC
jgi:hypothetical protein